MAERLACTVSELGERMSYNEFLDWCEYDAQHQCEEKSWVQNAMLMLQIDRACGNRKSKIDDYLPHRKRVWQEQDPVKIMDMFRMMASTVVYEEG